MANIQPFRAYRYSSAAGDPAKLLTQPYDKISPEMQQRYYEAHPKNLIRVILGRKEAADSESNNVYTRAGEYFRQWVADGTIVQDAAPGFYAYFQEFTVPGSDERVVRKGFIGLGEVVDYSEGIVHRHELTLAGPKKDRRQVLAHTGAHFGQIFMLYPDREAVIDAMLDEAATGTPVTRLTDEYGVVHSLWPITDARAITAIREQMADRKLLIADGHHRYETALAYRKDNPALSDARFVMMTFINMYSPGLKILGTHRLVKGLDSFDTADFLRNAGRDFAVTRYASVEELRQTWNAPNAEKVQIGTVFTADPNAYLFELKREAGDLDVRVLHDMILSDFLGIGEEAVRDEKHLKYVRGVDAAVALVRNGEYQMAFLLEPPTIEQVADISFGGGVMPQKSTDFYPKLLTGMAMYRLEQ